MKTLAKRSLPPAIVIVTAFYVGWPPPEPLDLGEDFISAKSVGWRPAELDPVVIAPLAHDPLAPVLVSVPSPSEMENGDLGAEGKTSIAVGGFLPTAEDLVSAHRVSGIATMGGDTWAVFNVGLKSVGDRWPMPGFDASECEVVSISDDFVEVQSGDLRVKLKPQRSRMARPVRTPPVAVTPPAPMGTRGNRPTTGQPMIKPPLAVVAPTENVHADAKL